MRNKVFVHTAATLLIGMGLVPSADAIVLDWASDPGANVTFVSTAAGADFTFEDEVAGSFDDFNITFSTTGSAVGLHGDIDGVFSYAAAGIVVAGPLETAAVTGIGTLSIDDGAGFILTATIDWVDIITVGTLGAVNISGTFNLTAIMYGGANADLMSMASGPDGLITSAFQLASAPTLTSIAAAPIGTTTVYNSHSGTMAVVPEPATMTLLGLGLAGFALRRRMRV